MQNLLKNSHIVIFNYPPLLPVVSAEVEMTAYGLLTYTLLGDVASALPVVKWLSQQRNSLGGFSSTQVALLLWVLLSFKSDTRNKIIP